MFADDMINGKENDETEKNSRWQGYDPRYIYSLVVRRYFADMKTKIEIAEELGVSRFKVARLIDEAIEQDYVRFIFPKQQAMDEEIASNLRKNFIWKMQLFFQLLNPGRRKKNSITNWVKSPLNILCNLFMKV